MEKQATKVRSAWRDMVEVHFGHTGGWIIPRSLYRECVDAGYVIPPESE